MADNFEAADCEKVDDAFFEHDSIPLRVANFDDSQEGLPVLGLAHVEVENLGKEVPRLLIVQVAEPLLVVAVVVHLNVEESEVELAISYLLNPLLVIVEDDREQDTQQVEDAHELEKDEEKRIEK